MGFEASSSSSQTLPTTENSPLIGKSNSHPLSSQLRTFANLFIAIVGAGVLGLPYTFKRTGWAFGSLILLSVAAVAYHCMMLLVHTRRHLESLRLRSSSRIDSFGDLGFVVCGPIGRFAVDLMIVLAQAGFCISYLIFIADTVANIFNSDLNPQILGLGFSPKSIYIWVCFPFQLGLNSIPTLTHLAPLSIFADVIDLGAMGVVMVEDVLVFLKKKPVLNPFGGFNTFLYGVGVAVYAFEGVGMILPLESETKNKDGFGTVLGLSMAFISILYGLFGVMGYFAFGDDTRDIITTNLGHGIASIVVQVGLCVNLFFTFPLMMNPVYEVFERRVCRSRYCLWLRWALVLSVSLVALLVPNFTDFLSLVGSSVCCALGFVLPALFHLIVFRGELGWCGVALDGVIVVMGLVIAVSGTCSSVMEILASAG